MVRVAFHMNMTVHVKMPVYMVDNGVNALSKHCCWCASSDVKTCNRLISQHWCISIYFFYNSMYILMTAFFTVYFLIIGAIRKNPVAKRNMEINAQLINS